jgi:hypothetical protein
MKPRISEADWLAASDPFALDLYSSAWKHFRKWRLFGVACCRRAMATIPDQRLEVLAACAEQFADGLLTWNEVKKVRRTLTRIRKELHETAGSDTKTYTLGALEGVTARAPLASLNVIRATQYAIETVNRSQIGAGAHQAELELLAIARDVFGNPFRPVRFDSDWRTSTAVALAKQMYDSRDFSAMPILADALQDAGCENDDVLNHCRDAAGVHVRGCWVVDLVLGKS